MEQQGGQEERAQSIGPWGLHLVVRADDRERTVLVSGLTTPPGGWKLAYAGPLPTKEDPNAPGLFPPGGCYLRKFRPCGTPAGAP